MAAILSGGAAANEPVTTRMIEAGPARIEVHAQGSGPVIVLLPSLGRGAEDFAELSALLSADGFRVLRPQPRGIGESRGPMTGITLHDLARDIAAVVEAEGQGPVVVGGHAFGNFVTRMLATDRPDLVRGAMMIAASAGKVPPGSTEKPIGPEMRRAIDGSGDMHLSEEERLKHLRTAFFAPGHDPRVWLGGWHHETHAAERIATTATHIDEYFAAGRAPVLDLQAAEDTVSPQRFGRVMKDALGDRVTVVVIPNAGHALVPEQPAAVAKAIAGWVRSLPKG